MRLERSKRGLTRYVSPKVIAECESIVSNGSGVSYDGQNGIRVRIPLSDFACEYDYRLILSREEARALQAKLGNLIDTGDNMASTGQSANKGL